VSRKHIVAAGDQTRKRIEPNLHDGVQQLVTLTLRLRAAGDSIPGELIQTRAELRQVEEGLKDMLDELREISHGLQGRQRLGRGSKSQDRQRSPGPCP
jgi:signal transduction histidine kinase